MESVPSAAAQSRQAAGSTLPSKLSLRVAVADTAAPLIPNAVMWLAGDLGFYGQQGLDVELIELSGTPLAAAALVSGQADVANLDTAAVIDMVATGKADLRAIHSPNIRQYFLIASSADVRTPADLKGKLFGVARLGSADYAQSTVVLRSLGLDPAGDVQFIGIGDPTTRARALLAGNVQATTFSVATWQLIRHEPTVRVLVDANAFFRAAPIVGKVNAASIDVIRGRPEELVRFTKAVILAARYLAENEQAWITAMATRRADIERTHLAELWHYYREGWAVNGLMNLALYEETARFLYASGALPNAPEITVDRWTTTRFVDQALVDLGIYPGSDDPGRYISHTPW